MLSFSRCKPFVGVIAGAAIAGCAGNGAGLDANGQPISSGGGTTPPLTATFQSIQANVFTPICTRCHIGAGAPEGLQLDAAHSYSLLVGVPSAEVPSLQRVRAGDPNNSYIVLKLQGSAGIVGGQMPLGGPYLPQSTIAVIRQWITNGAPQAAAGVTPAVKSTGVSASAPTQGSTGGFAVTATSPLSDSVVTDPVATIVVAFSGEVDTTLVNYTTVRLERAQTGQATSSMGSTAMPVTPVEPTAASGPFETQLPISVALARGNPAAMVITPAAPLGTGTYRVTLRGTGGGALADVNAQALGTDYSLVFTVEVSP
jgi:methionine-rich copper-binding protein CopC